jgi:predicted acetyltransferase
MVVAVARHERDAGTEPATPGGPTIDQIVGSTGVFTRDLAVPGGVLAAGHISSVAVAADHRRRGLMRAMMRWAFDHIRAAGEPLAVLWASEGRIYQRLGFGLSTLVGSIEAQREVQLIAPRSASPGRLRLVDPTQARKELRQVYDEAWTERVGWSSRDDRWWDYLLSDPVQGRRGATARRCVVHEAGRGVDGYALYRVRGEWTPAGPSGTVLVSELVAANPVAYEELCRFVLGLDLTRTTQLSRVRPDEPLLYQVNEPRRLQVRLGDGLWVRVLDLPAALSGRRYLAPVDVVLEVTDELVPQNAGRWRLTGGQEGGQCHPTPEPADLACDISALGAAYLGGVSLTTLAAAGRIRELDAGTLAAASWAMRWDPSPSAMEVF